MQESRMNDFLDGKKFDEAMNPIVKKIKSSKAQLISLANPKCKRCSGVGHRGTFYPDGSSEGILLICNCVAWDKIKEEPEGKTVQNMKEPNLVSLSRPHPKKR